MFMVLYLVLSVFHNKANSKLLTKENKQTFQFHTRTFYPQYVFDLGPIQTNV